MLCLGTRYAEVGKTPDLKMTGAALADFYAGSCKGYPLITIEGPFDQAIGLVGWFHREGGPTQVFVSSAEENDSAELEEEERDVSPDPASREAAALRGVCKRLGNVLPRPAAQPNLKTARTRTPRTAPWPPSARPTAALPAAARPR